MKDKFIIVTGNESENKYGIKVSNICDFVYYTERQYTELKVIERLFDNSTVVRRYEIKETAKEISDQINQVLIPKSRIIE